MKLDKIQLAIISAEMLASVNVFGAAASTNGVVDNFTTPNSKEMTHGVSGDGNADIYSSTAPALGATATSPGTAVKTVTPGGGFIGRTSSSVGGVTVYSYAAGSVSSGSNTKGVALGDDAVAAYGVQENPDFVAGGTAPQYYGGNAATAIGTSAVGALGGTAVGNEAVATGRDSVAIGKEAVASGYKSISIGEDSYANAAYSMAVGNGAVAEGEDSTALGAEAEASGENSVALGAGSVADRDNNVSVGSAENQRTISNVAPGVYGTDAVNVNQLKAVERKISAGVSAAMAMTTPVIAAGKSNGVALGAASYNNTSAVALNLAHKFTDDVVATASVSKGFNSGRTSSGSNDDIGIKGSVSWSF
jgi:autotransporter adhesin